LKNIRNGKKLLISGYQIVLKSENKAFIRSKMQKKLTIKLSLLGEDQTFYLQARRENNKFIDVNKTYHTLGKRSGAGKAWTEMRSPEHSPTYGGSDMVSWLFKTK
jgi:hypothetical protein